MLDVNNLTKTFGNKKAVNDVSFTIKEGEVFSLIGPNSSWKNNDCKNNCWSPCANSWDSTVGDHNVVKNPEKAKTLVGYPR